MESGKIINTTNQYFLIVDKVNGFVHRIELKKDVGVIKQINDSYDNYLKERDFYDEKEL